MSAAPPWLRLSQGKAVDCVMYAENWQVCAVQLRYHSQEQSLYVSNLNIYPYRIRSSPNIYWWIMIEPISLVRQDTNQWMFQWWSWFVAAEPSLLHYRKFHTMKSMRPSAVKVKDGYILRNIWPDDLRSCKKKKEKNAVWSEWTVTLMRNKSGYVTPWPRHKV